MDFSAQITKAIDHLKKEFAGLQTGRASAALVDDIHVESYGAQMNLKSVANISCPDAKTIKIEPWDKSLMSEIEKAIQSSNIGINPQNMGEHIFLPVPPMTEERRKQMVKVVHEMVENAKIAIRNARHDEMKSIKLLKDESEISEDEQKSMEKEVQEKVDVANKEIEEIGKNKENEVMTV